MSRSEVFIITGWELNNLPDLIDPNLFYSDCLDEFIREFRLSESIRFFGNTHIGFIYERISDSGHLQLNGLLNRINKVKISCGEQFDEYMTRRHHITLPSPQIYLILENT